jgi:hypothetical protein
MDMELAFRLWTWTAACTRLGLGGKEEDMSERLLTMCRARCHFVG